MRTPLLAAFLLTSLVACGADDGGGGTVDAPVGVHAFVPQPTGTCPAITSGDVMFAPAGMPPRMVKLALSATAATGPLIIYWHATGSAPTEAAYALGATEDALIQSGAVIAAPYSDPTAGQFEWFIVNMSQKQDDFLLADEVIACLAQAGRIDTDHVHSMGMSAGALQTTAVSYLRSSYIASVVTYSGGVPAIFTPPPLDPDNKFAALIFHGGTSDNVFNVDFKMASETYANMLTTAGHFATLCDHGQGHSIPLDAAPSAAQFFADNGFGDWPSPYASAGLPASFPTYCAR
jgi:predicted esterase